MADVAAGRPSAVGKQGQPRDRREAEELRRRKHKERQKAEAAKSQKEKAAKASAAAAANAGSKGAGDNRLHRDTPFICGVRFRNDLPEIPCDPKMLVVPVEDEKLGHFSVTALEKQPKREVLLPPDMGITISVMDTNKFSIPHEKAAVDPVDAILLEEAALHGDSAAKVQPKAQNLSWMMKTTYLTAETDTIKVRRHNKPPADITTAAPSAPKDLDDKAASIRAINASFEAAKQTPVHPTKRHLRATEILPILPDVGDWHKNYVQIKFDNEPTRESNLLAHLTPKQRKHVATRAIMKSYNAGKDDKMSGEETRFIAWIAPKAVPKDDDAATASTSASEGSKWDAGCVDPEDLVGEYEWVREYSYKMKRHQEDASGDKPVYLVKFGSSAVTYCDLNVQLSLSKRRRVGIQNDIPRPSAVFLRNRPINDAEKLEQSNKLAVLYGSYGNVAPVDDNDAEFGAPEAEAAMAASEEANEDMQQLSTQQPQEDLFGERDSE